MSELWLDTEIAEQDLARIAHVMAESGFDIATLRAIYLVEVAPVVSWNLLGVAGVWTTFDPQWLHSAIVHNLRYRARYLRFLARFPLTRRLMTYATEEHWTKLVEFIAKRRATTA